MSRRLRYSKKKKWRYKMIKPNKKIRIKKKIGYVFTVLSFLPSPHIYIYIYMFIHLYFINKEMGNDPFQKFQGFV